MGVGVVIGFVIIAILLFLAVKYGWISDRNFQITIGVAGIVGALAAATVFIVPPPVSSDTPTPESSNTPKPTDTPQSTPTWTPAHTRTPIPIPTVIVPGPVLFEENFEDGSVNGFVIESGIWKIIVDETGNKVYENNKNASVWPSVRFGSSEWRDYAVEYRVKLIDFDNSKDTSGIGLVQFRNAYAIVINPYWGGFGIDYLPQTGTWGGVAESKYNFEPNIWYSIRVEASDKNLKVFLNGDLRMDTEDTRATSGFLRLKTSPNTIVAFDDVRVISLGE